VQQHAENSVKQQKELEENLEQEKIELMSQVEHLVVEKKKLQEEVQRHVEDSVKQQKEMEVNQSLAASLQQELEEERSASQEIQEEIRALEEQLATERDQAREQQAVSARTDQALTESKAKVQKLQAKNTRMEQALSDSNTRIQDFQVKLEAAQAERQKAIANAGKKDQLLQLQKDLAAMQIDRDALQAQCHQLTDDLNEVVMELKRQQEKHAAAVSSLQEKLAEALTEGWSQVTSWDAVNCGHMNHKQKIQYVLRLKESLNSLLDELKRSRQQNLQLQVQLENENRSAEYSPGKCSPGKQSPGPKLRAVLSNATNTPLQGRRASTGGMPRDRN
jgi:myosin heavy subunit